MSIKFVNGNILTFPERDEDTIICHQVNCKGVMGAGLAKQIRDKWPDVYDRYRLIAPASLHLRKKRSKANKNIPIAGQMTLFGDVIQEEREIPPLMSRNYMNPNTVKKKEYLLLHAFD